MPESESLPERRLVPVDHCRELAGAAALQGGIGRLGEKCERRDRRAFGHAPAQSRGQLVEAGVIHPPALAVDEFRQGVVQLWIELERARVQLDGAFERALLVGHESCLVERPRIGGLQP